MTAGPLRLLLLVLTTPLLLASCGDTSSAGSAADPGASTPSHSSTPSPHEASSWAGFPLDLGYPNQNGDDHSPVKVRPRPATRAFRLCGHAAWDPREGTRGVRGVEYRGEAEYSRGRTLVRYPTARAAGAAIARLRRAVAACHDEPNGKSGGTTHTLVGHRLGAHSLVWTDTFYNLSRGEQQHDTGLVVYAVVRAGRDVLLAYQYDEGNGTPASRRESIAQAVRHERAVVDRLRGLSSGRSGSRA